MSRRSHRFRATVWVPELGQVEVRGLSPEALRALPVEMPEEFVGSKHDHPVYIAVIVAGCVRPQLSGERVHALPESSRDLLADAIMGTHPAVRQLYAESKAELA